MRPDSPEPPIDRKLVVFGAIIGAIVLLGLASIVLEVLILLTVKG